MTPKLFFNLLYITMTIVIGTYSLRCFEWPYVVVAIALLVVLQIVVNW